MWLINFLLKYIIIGTSILEIFAFFIGAFEIKSIYAPPVFFLINLHNITQSTM